MENWVEECRRILERSATGALPFSTLKDELARAGILVGSRDQWLLVALETREQLFRVVRIAGGPWVREPMASRHIPALEDPWIVLRECSRDARGPGEAIMGKIREAVQAWGRCLDDGSPSGVARWIRANEEGTSAFRVLLRAPLRCE